ncbi:MULTISPECIES: hypothetical protein [Agrobacterium]|uniref:Uncharacterized protein n=1 Tax=Agrobacterium tumefaciens TaxID=358 RepID=A0AAE6EDY0_AGRTU|nr:MULTISPECIES: hypothetical protein [Agrobacterium]QCL72713.1 hypothetical protein CFBP5499_04240 [Agrobacterium tumefaciens]QCL78288.1 hypothetical protein CFBP5877_03800 [Agrobacterium tumefaciens]CUX15320.1 hypothetical protein AGR6A_Cc100018 [Agrobacterium sp. NCPPB 925]
MVDKIKIKRQAGTPSERQVETTVDDVIKDVGTAPEFIPASTLTLTDKHQGRLLAFTAACTVTIPAGLRGGFSCGWLQAGTGAITFAASGVTVNSFEGKVKSAGQWAAGGIAAIEAEKFLLYGNMGD